MTPRPRATDCLPVRFIAAPPMRGHRTYLDFLPAASPAAPAGTPATRAQAVEACFGANREPRP